jgi:uncharacterized ParB-like nuclease family protein
MLPISQLLFPEPVSSGLDVLKLIKRILQYRRTNEHRKPIQVTLLGYLEGQPVYRIADGRHRTVSSMGAGRKTVLAQVVDQP